MRISITNPGKPAESLYIIKDLYLRDVRGKKSASNKSGKDRTTVTVEKLGKVSDLMKKMNLSHDEVIAWARQRAKSLTDEEKAANAKITIDYFPNQRIEKDVPSSCNCGYLFLQSLYPVKGIEEKLFQAQFVPLFFPFVHSRLLPALYPPIADTHRPVVSIPVRSGSSP